MLHVVRILHVLKAFAGPIYVWKVPWKILFFIGTTRLFELVASILCKKIDQVFDHGFIYSFYEYFNVPNS